MRRRFALILAAGIACALAGCKTSQTVSKVFPADMDTTWAAVLRVVEKDPSQKPTKVDRDNGKIITGLVYGDVGHQVSSDAPVIESTVDVWRGIIALKPEGSGTKVSVRVQKASIEGTTDPLVAGQRPADIGFVFWDTDTDWQKQFLKDVAAELAGK